MWWRPAWFSLKGKVGIRVRGRAPSYPTPPSAPTAQPIRAPQPLAIVEFGEGHLGIGVDERLLVDASDPLHIADVERVLRPAVARALALELAVGFLVRLGLLQRGKLAFGQDQALLGHLGFE